MIVRSAAFVLGCAALCRVWAQTSTATLVGIATDPSGALVSGARVEVRNEDTNALRKSESDAKGEFVVPNLAPGLYDVSIVKEGFRTMRQSHVELQVDQQVRLEFRMELGAVSQTVSIQASVPLINTENAVKGEVMVSDEILQMPLISRAVTDLAFLTPGVVQNTAGVGGASASPMVVNGARADNSNFVIDGFNARDPRDASLQVTPNLDALQEFKMQVSGYSAETGRQGGGVMTMVLKTGGNALHGSMFEYFRNNDLNARNFFDGANPSTLHRNQFGATLSGPVMVPKIYRGKDRTFFLFSWESYRQNSPSPVLSVVPSLAQRKGDFSGFPALKNPLSTPANAPFPGNIIPTSLQSPVALAAQSFLPLPNYPGVNNFFADSPNPGSNDSFVAKGDQKVTGTGNLSIKFVINRSSSIGPYNGGNSGAFGFSGWSHNWLGGLTHTQSFTPQVINEFRFGLARTVGHYAGVHAGTDYNKQLGLPGPSDPKLIGFPLILISGYDQIGDAVGWPNTYLSTSYNTSDTVTWVKGTHLIKIGGDVLRSQLFEGTSTNTRGTFQFTGFWTGQPYADFMMGLLNADSREVVWSTDYLFNTSYSVFVQDDWKPSSRLTLNLGLRYELPLPLNEKFGRLTNFVPLLNKLVIASTANIAPGVTFSNASQAETAQDAGLPPSLIKADYKAWAPRFGFAFRPFRGNRTVVRGGYGIFYGSAGLTINLYGALSAVFPFSITQTINRTAVPTYLTFANPFPVPANLAGASTTVTGFQTPILQPYAQNWNFIVEEQLGGNMAVEMGYSGSKGTHLARAYNLNQAYGRSAARPTGITPFPQWGTITYFCYCFDSSYNAFTVTLRRRFARNFFYRVNYSYSKAIDDGSVLQGGGAGGYAGLQDSRNRALERGRGDLDVPHLFTTSFSWVVPWKANRFIRGWQLAGSGIAHTGAPFTPQVTNANLNLGEASRPNRIAKGAAQNPSVNRWYDLSAFPVVPDGSFGDGTSGRNILDGPGSIAINLALSRNFTILEKSNLQFRGEVFNVLNHANFNAPVVFVNAPNAGTITTAGASRQMQLALRYSF
jgi:hypothetical protein